MNQSFDTELTVVLRALQEVVLPALDGAEKHVVEQLQLSVAALNFMRQRLPQAGRFFRIELADYACLAQAAAALLDPFDVTEAEALRSLADTGQTMLRTPTADWSEYIEVTRRLREAIARGIERGTGAPYQSALNELVMVASSKMHMRTRAWYLPFGFEIDPQLLPSLD